MSDKDWISVEVRLPKVGERVLVICYDPRDHRDIHVNISTYMGKNRMGSPLWSRHKHVLYWQPLLEVPEWVNRRISK
jgi:hypothetical protein